MARAKFVAAYGHCRRPSTLVSAANMALKMGDAASAASEYEEALHMHSLHGGLFKPSVVAVVEKKLGEARATLQQRGVVLSPKTKPSPSTASTSPLLEEVERQASELVSKMASLWMNATGRAPAAPEREPAPPSLSGLELRAWQRRGLAMRAARARAARPTVRARLVAALLTAAHVLLVCGVLAFVVAMVHVAWASRGDACRGLAAARGTLTLANATLADVQEGSGAAMVSLVVIEPAASLVSLVASAAAGSAAAAEAGEWLSGAAAAVLAAYWHALAEFDDTCRARAAPPACVKARRPRAGRALAAPARTARQLSCGVWALCSRTVPLLAAVQAAYPLCGAAPPSSASSAGGVACS